MLFAGWGLSYGFSFQILGSHPPLVLQAFVAEDAFQLQYRSRYVVYIHNCVLNIWKQTEWLYSVNSMLSPHVYIANKPNGQVYSSSFRSGCKRCLAWAGFRVKVEWLHSFCWLVAQTVVKKWKPLWWFCLLPLLVALYFWHENVGSYLLVHWISWKKHPWQHCYNALVHGQLAVGK